MNPYAFEEFAKETAAEQSARNDLLAQLLYISCRYPDDSTLHLESLEFILTLGKGRIGDTVSQVVCRRISELKREALASSHTSDPDLKYAQKVIVR